MTTEKTQLTPEDPVDLETLAQFERIQLAKQDLALVLVRIEQDKLEVLRSVSRLDEQNRRLFETCLVDRGLPPTAEVEIDSKTGKLLSKGSGTPPAAKVEAPSSDPKPEG